MRTLSRDHTDYKAKYFGDLRARDAAYHQGTVWAWLMGPFIDAWLKVHPEERSGARKFWKDLCRASTKDVSAQSTRFSTPNRRTRRWMHRPGLECRGNTQVLGETAG